MPSVSYYFDWINSQYEGPTEAHTLVNLEFFRWLHEEYGFALDVYLLDVGNIDDGPYTAGVGRLIPDHYGTLESESFRAQFPRGFRPLRDAAAAFGCRLGIWLGPDGFGDTPEAERARAETLVSLCRDYGFRMFKFDAVAGELRPEKRDVLLETLAECRRYSPDLLVLNERVDLLEGAPGVTTSLWEGIETYIDVFSWNETTAPHHRAGALARPHPPGLTCRLEDHGVCLSSGLDRWDDDLVLQTFNRGTVLAPEIYGSPWFLRDDELPRFARLCNLYRKYREILVDAIALPEEEFGPHAVSRGNGELRFLTLTNLTWEPVRYRIPLDETIGLRAEGYREIRRFHPSQRILGGWGAGKPITVEVEPFRVLLLSVSDGRLREVGMERCDYEIVRDVPGRPLVMELFAEGDSSAVLGLVSGGRDFRRSTLDGDQGLGEFFSRSFPSDPLIEFPGERYRKPWHRLLGRLTPCPVPADAEALYEATCFAADSNALEIRSLERAGPTAIPAVAAARAAFLAQPMFVNRGIWDRQLFDGDLATFFIARREGGALRLDLGEAVPLGRLLIRTRDREASDIAPALDAFAPDARAEWSGDLREWHSLDLPAGKGTIATLRFPAGASVRTVRIAGAPRRIAEIEGSAGGARLDRSRWRASNLLAPYRAHPAVAAWNGTFVLDEIVPEAYLAVAIEGRHGNEGAYAALRVDGELAGAPDRAVSFPSNTWEYQNVEVEEGYTYFFPLDSAVAGKEIEVVVLALEGGGQDLAPAVWLTAHRPPLVAHELVLYEE
ncbi:MAG: hypothetical protein AB1726_01350 [Planctomycetota bacterium]